MKIHFVLPLLHRENNKQKGAILVILAITFGGFSWKMYILIPGNLKSKFTCLGILHSDQKGYINSILK